MTGRPQTIQERIACWQQAFYAVLDETTDPKIPAPLVRPITQAMTDQRSTDLYAQWRSTVENAARVAATLAIGATARSRNTGGE